MPDGGQRVEGPTWIDWYVWRVVDARIGTLAEVESRWSLTDLAAAHTVLDMREDVERLAHLQRRAGG